MNSLSNPAIVIIDDDQDDRDMLSTALQSHGFMVECFEEAQVAMEALKAHRNNHTNPVMIVCDYNMPTINGEELLQLVKAEMFIKDIPVIIYSTSISRSLSKLLMERGAYATITKAKNYKDFLGQVLDIRQLVQSQLLTHPQPTEGLLLKPFNLAAMLVRATMHRVQHLFGAVRMSPLNLQRL